MLAPDPRLETANDALVARLQAGDALALAQLYDAYGALVYGLARRILADGLEAEEATQDVFVYVWRNAERFDRSRGQLGRWLATLARSRAIDRLRARDSQARRVERLAQENASSPAIVRIDPFAELERRERHARVCAALAELPLDQRRAIEIAYLEGLSYREVAMRLGAPLGTVKTRIRQGMIRLRILLEADES